jgi:hypothetical protein
LKVIKPVIVTPALQLTAVGDNTTASDVVATVPTSTATPTLTGRLLNSAGVKNCVVSELYDYMFVWKKPVTLLVAFLCY